jgi:putative ABC transport system ATP-binding protein
MASNDGAPGLDGGAQRDMVIKLEGVSVRYGAGESAVWALSDVSLEVAQGEFVAVTGPSGSGKTTLLNLVGGLERPSSGRVLVDGRDVNLLGVGDLARLRRRTVAYIFQFFNLLPTLTAAQNVEVPLRADGLPRGEIAERVARALSTVGMTHRGEHLPRQLSGGEMQRVAIARALATGARVLLADEPTGNLDVARGEEVLEALHRVTADGDRTVILATHDPRAAAYGNHLVTLRDGKISDELVDLDTPAAVS